MILVDDAQDGGMTPSEPFPDNLSVHQMLIACAGEATHQAEVMAKLDAEVGDALNIGALSGKTAALQSVDLLRQEVLALSRVLHLLCELGSHDAPVNRGALMACVPTAAQRARLAR
jgi:hypothetical protein